MLPLNDDLPARRFPIVSVTLIAVNIAVWLFYELPDLNGAVADASFYPCEVNGTCDGPQPWGVSWLTAMFMHASWDHLLGNMLFLAVFGKSVEDTFGRLRFLAFYIAGGFAATALQTGITLSLGTAQEAQIPMLGASGAIAAVMGAYSILFPKAKIRTLVLIFVVPIRAWFYLGAWFLWQLYQGGFALFAPSESGDSGVAFFAHIGGYLFGVAVAWALRNAGRITPQGRAHPAPHW
jgi:membrane associated rhomboid family serine protease